MKKVFQLVTKQFSQKENRATIVLVTSIFSGEGKSTTAANLGAIFQMAEYKSIVIDLTIHHEGDT
jgi:Mrp family chromosome partitioning ATPase